jgi:hypothetical protein
MPHKIHKFGNPAMALIISFLVFPILSPMHMCGVSDSCVCGVLVPGFYYRLFFSVFFFGGHGFGHSSDLAFLVPIFFQSPLFSRAE